MPTPAHLLDEQQERRWKSSVLSLASVGLFLLLVLRLFTVQIIDAEKNMRLSKENSMQLVVLKAPRGQIFDRNGRLLALNRPSYSICILPYKIKDRNDVIQKLLRLHKSDGTHLFDSTTLVAAIHKAYARRFDPTSLIEDASIDLVSIIEEHSCEIPGVVVEIESRREYPLGAATFHVLGYMGEIPPNQFDSLKKLGYRYGDLIGKAGIEQQYESELHGTNGQQYVEVNAYGKVMRVIEEMPAIAPTPGLDAILTIDAELQKVTADSFPDTLKGAVVAIDPRSGEVLVMFSSPSIDPNIFSFAQAIRNAAWASAAADPNLPLNNRVTMGTYTPGSTFKLISAIAGLSAGVLHENSRMPRPCGGSFRFGNRIAKCWIHPRGHGAFTLVDAIRQSCNVYFFQVGLALDDKLINSYARMFALGKKTGIDLPQEKEGWLSGEEEYNKRWESRGWRWTSGLLLDLAIGQAQVVTPLQLALMVGGLGNGKSIYVPFLLKELRGADGKAVRLSTPRIMHSLTVSPEAIEVIRKAMKGVVLPGGTGGRAQVSGVPVGGKTGSAQNPQGKLPHALFVACAPVDTPVIAIAVVLENAGHGGSVAAPIAGSILRYYFANNTEGKKISERYTGQTNRQQMTQSNAVVPPIGSVTIPLLEQPSDGMIDYD